jgi:hypothetical protein
MPRSADLPDLQSRIPACFPAHVYGLSSFICSVRQMMVNSEYRALLFADTNRDPFHMLLDLHAAAPKLGDSDVAQCFWPSVLILSSRGCIGRLGRGSKNNPW